MARGQVARCLLPSRVVVCTEQSPGRIPLSAHARDARRDARVLFVLFALPRAGAQRASCQNALTVVGISSKRLWLEACMGALRNQVAVYNGLPGLNVGLCCGRGRHRSAVRGHELLHACRARSRHAPEPLALRGGRCHGSTARGARQRVVPYLSINLALAGRAS